MVAEMSHPGGTRLFFRGGVAERLARLAVECHADGIITPATRPDEGRGAPGDRGEAEDPLSRGGSPGRRCLTDRRDLIDGQWSGAGQFMAQMTPQRPQNRFPPSADDETTGLMQDDEPYESPEAESGNQSVCFIIPPVYWIAWSGARNSRIWFAAKRGLRIFR